MLQLRKELARFSRAGYLLAVFAASCGGDAAAPKSGLNLEGTVTNNQTHAPVAAATVVTGSYEGTVYTPRVTVSTNAQGRYLLDDECTARNYIEVRAQGYLTIVTAVACAPYRRTLDVPLEPAP